MGPKLRGGQLPSAVKPGLNCRALPHWPLGGPESRQGLQRCLVPQKETPYFFLSSLAWCPECRLSPGDSWALCPQRPKRRRAGLCSATCPLTRPDTGLFSSDQEAPCMESALCTPSHEHEACFISVCRVTTRPSAVVGHSIPSRDSSVTRVVISLQSVPRSFRVAAIIDASVAFRRVFWKHRRRESIFLKLFLLN